MADTWTMLSGSTASDYVDTMVFEVVSATKKIRPLSGQTLVAGEKNSQYVRFEMDRFWDGIDISAKNFSITYSLAGKYYGTSEAVSAEVSTDKLRFGWIVPEEACCIAGTLMFVLVIKSDGYVLKTQIAETPVVKSLDEDSVVPEPTREAWYKEFQARVQEDLDASQAALTNAQDALTRANNANDAASSALTAASEANLAAQDAIEVAKIRYGSPLVANAGPEMVDTNRVYVFTGSESAYTYGHWYYYDNGVWNDGGVYNGEGVVTDKTLSVENMPADAKATGDEISELKEDLTAIDDNLGLYDIGTTYSTLNATYNRVMAIYPIKNVDDTFFFSVKNKSTNGTLSIRVCKNPTPYSADLLESVGSMGNADTDLSGSFTISDSAKANAKYIVFLNAKANLVVSFNVTMWTEKSVTGELKQSTETADFLNTATMFDFQQYVQGGVNGSNGTDAYSPATVRPDAYFDVIDLVKVSLGSSSGLHVQLYSYGSDMSYLGRNDLGASAFSYTTKQIQAYRSAKYVRFAIYLDGGGNFSPSDLKANGKFAVTLTSISAVPSMNRNTNTVFSNMLKKVGTTPMASWIDDDGVVAHTNGGINGVVMPVADAVGIPVTFAVIPPLSDSVTVDGQTMTKADYFKDRQKEGHQIVSHPVHTYWYGSQYDIAKVNPSLIECLTELQSNGFLHSDMLVYPGSSGADNAVVEIVRKWCKCGVLSGYGTPNHLGDSTKWAIKRTFVNFEDYNSIHSSDAGYTSAMDWYKSQIDDTYTNGDWIVFGTHSYQFTTSTDTSDPNANTMGNLQMLMQYAVDKGLEFRTLWDVYNRRKYLFEFNEINQ